MHVHHGTHIYNTHAAINILRMNKEQTDSSRDTVNNMYKLELQKSGTLIYSLKTKWQPARLAGKHEES